VDVRLGNVSRPDTPPPEPANSAEGRISAEAQAADRQQPVELPSPVSNLAASAARVAALHFFSGSPDWAPPEIAAIAATDGTPHDDGTLDEGLSDGDSRSRTLELANLAPQAGKLLAGIVPFDVPALERGVRSFFSRIENLGGDLSNSEWMTGLVPWVTGVSAVIVAYEFARRHRERAVRDWAAVGAGGSVTWTWLSGTALVPPEDER
jgi:hypothetical protein